MVRTAYRLTLLSFAGRCSSGATDFWKALVHAEQEYPGAELPDIGEWDHQFLYLIEKDPEVLTRLTLADYARLGGWESTEVIMWLIMRGALQANVTKVHQSYYLPSMTGIATAVYENSNVPCIEEGATEWRREMARQTCGLDELEGTYPFTLEVSNRAYRLNEFLHGLIHAEARQSFLADLEAACAKAGLSNEERKLVQTRDWRGMIHYGVIFFLLEKLGAVVGVSNLHIYAAMRGETFEEFQKSRNTNAVYSVAGRGDSSPSRS